MTPRRTVLVLGPPLAGVGGVVGALRRHLSEHDVVEADDVADRAPDAVVAVVSAVAPVPRTQWELIERAAARTDLVIGVVSKVDAHRRWREVMEADRTLVAGWVPRHRSMPWVAVAATPDLGEPRLAALVDLLRERLADRDLDRRNHLRCNQLRQERETGAAAGVRTAVARTRLELLRLVRNRCSAMRTELRERASAVPVGGSARFESAVRDRALGLLDELDDEISRTARGLVADVELHVDHPRDPPDLSRSSPSRRLEGRLMAVLGMGFGLGIALASSRVLAGLASGPSLVGLAAGSAVGLAMVVWVVRVRALLNERALLDRWVSEVVATLRWHGEAMVAERLLAAESAHAEARSRRACGLVPVRPELGCKDITDQYEW